MSEEINDKQSNEMSNESNNSSQEGFGFERSKAEQIWLTAKVSEVRALLSQYVIGQHEAIELMLAGIFSNGHLLLEGVPGVAKTLSAKVLAKALSIDFSRIQFTPDLMPSDVIGTSVFNMKEATFNFKKGPVFSNIVLIDEINRAPAKTQAALFEVMEERQITYDGVHYNMEFPFLVVATQNPIEQEGTYNLPEAQLDRFLFKVKVHYPEYRGQFGEIHCSYYVENQKSWKDLLGRFTACFFVNAKIIKGNSSNQRKRFCYARRYSICCNTCSQS